MKITDIQTILLTGPSTNDPFFLEARQLRSAALIEIHTNGPHTGVGESYAGYFCPEVVPMIVEFYKPILLGADPCDIHTLRQRMEQCGAYWSRVGLGSAVLAGIEAALWDLKGKLLGLPVYELLGGRRHDRLLAYATGGVSNWPPDRLKAKLDFYLGLGFRAFKVGAGYYDAAAWSGGLSEFMRIAHMFDSRKQQIATHSWGAGVAQMQNLHAGFAAPNTAILETPPAPGALHTELWGESFVMRDGYVLPPEQPGLGVRLTDAIKANYPFVPGSGEFNSVPGKILTS